MHSHQMTNPQEIQKFLLAGRARITLVSKKTGSRCSYRVKESDDGNVHFVSVLTGSDNENSYTYMGILKNSQFMLTKKSKITKDATSFKAFDFFWAHLQSGKVPDQLEVWHEGTCGKCGRALTVPESIARGIGPECAKNMGYLDSNQAVLQLEDA